MMHRPHQLLITCEHAVNQIPPFFQEAFAPHQALLSTHRGYDIGAANLARRISEEFKLPYFEAMVSRLLIDCNRSLGHPHCFSELSSCFDEQMKSTIIDAYYKPYRNAVSNYIQSMVHERPILHLSIHSFTPNLHGVERLADIGLLYHPGRVQEQILAKEWQTWLSKACPAFKIRRNYPYQGKSDGLVQSLRKQFSEKEYLGFEIEFNQKLFAEESSTKMVEDLAFKWLKSIIH